MGRPRAISDHDVIQNSLLGYKTHGLPFSAWGCHLCSGWAQYQTLCWCHLGWWKWALCFVADLCPPAVEHLSSRSLCGSRELAVHTTLQRNNVFFFKMLKPQFPYEHNIFHVCSLLWMKEAMLSLVSVMVIETEVVAVLPEAIPLRSWALTTTTYWLLVSRSRVFILQLITPGRYSDRFGQTGGGC